MKKSVTFLLFTVVFSFFVFAFGTKDKQNLSLVSQVRIAVLNGPSGIGFVPLFENEVKIDNIPISMEVLASPDVLLPKLIKGEIDMGVLPPNLAAKVYNTSSEILLLAVTGKGMLSFLSSDSDITGIENLKGKRVFVAGQASTPEYVLRYLANQAGIPIDTNENDSMKLDFSIPTAELAASIASGIIDYAFLPEPFATVAQMNNPKLKSCFDVQKLYQSFSGSKDSYPMTVLVARKSFVQENTSLTKKVLNEVEKAIQFVNEHPQEAGLLVEKHSLGLKAPIVSKSIPKSAFAYSPAFESQKEIEALLSLFLEFAPESIGGKLPSKDFYFK